jgi:hypothetical protein
VIDQEGQELWGLADHDLPCYEQEMLSIEYLILSMLHFVVCLVGEARRRCRKDASHGFKHISQPCSRRFDMDN